MNYSRYKELLLKAKSILKDKGRRDANKLHEAVCELSFLRSEQIPELYRTDLTEFMTLFEKGTPVGEEGIIMASINAMDPREVKTHIKKIESFY